jgi:hypothetical protein
VAPISPFQPVKKTGTRSLLSIKLHLAQEPRTPVDRGGTGLWEAAFANQGLLRPPLRPPEQLYSRLSVCLLLEPPSHTHAQTTEPLAPLLTLTHARCQLSLEPEDAISDGPSLLAKIIHWVGVSGPYDLHACAREMGRCASEAFELRLAASLLPPSKPPCDLQACALEVDRYTSEAST